MQKANEAASKAELHQMLSDWFDWMNLEKWEVQWKPTNKFDLPKLLIKHHTWMNDAPIDGTPTLFLNGKKYLAGIVLIT